MDKLSALEEAFKRMYQPPPVLTVVEVVSVEGDTCTVRAGAGLNVPGVRLRPASGSVETKMLITPRTGSLVLTGSQSGDWRECNVIAVEEPEKIEITGEKINLLMDISSGAITINGGELGGVVKIRELNDNLKSIADYAKAINSALPAAFSAIGAGMAASGALGSQSYSTAMAGKTITVKDMEDTNITH